MKAVILIVSAVLAADSLFPATPMDPLPRQGRPAVVRTAAPAATQPAVKKVKKRRSFGSLLGKSAGFLASSAVVGGMEDR